jgi:RsiW-degrading membrane proteinase PrsW (M82 family)
MGWVGAVGVAAGGAVLWNLYFRFKDRLKPEPLKLLAVSLMLGAAAAGMAIVVFLLLWSALIYLAPRLVAGIRTN